MKLWIAFLLCRSCRDICKLVVERARIKVVLHFVDEADLIDSVDDNATPADLLVGGLVAAEIALVGAGEGPAHDDGRNLADNLVADEGEVRERVEEREAEQVLELDDTVGLAERTLVHAVIADNLVDDLEVLVVEQVVHLQNQTVPEGHRNIRSSISRGSFFHCCCCGGSSFAGRSKTGQKKIFAK